MIMDRQNFIDTFNEYFQKNESRFFHFNIEVKNSSNELEFNENLHQLFIPFFDSINVKNKYAILNKVENNKQYDAYYEEDNPDSEYCSFTCQININNLYDIVKKSENYHQDKVDIYRIESGSNKGLYDTFFAALKVDETNHPNPREDIQFNGIFDPHNNDYKYFKKWHFGFENLQDLKNWLITDENLTKVGNSGCIIKKITVDKNYVINGYKQLIFQLDEKLSEEIIDWKEINKSTKELYLKMKKYDLEMLVFDACKSGDLNLIKNLLEDKDLNIDINCFDGSFLHAAAKSGHIKILQYLLTSETLKEHIDIHSAQGLALKNACENGHLEVVKYLLTSPELTEHARINEDNCLAFKNACEKNHFEIIKYLLTSQDLKENLDLSKNENVIIIAADNDNINLARYLLTSKDLNGQINIHYAEDSIFRSTVQNNQINFLQFLIFEMNIEKTESIKKFLNESANKEVDRLFELRDLNNRLEDNLEIKNINNKKLKL